MCNNKYTNRNTYYKNTCSITKKTQLQIHKYKYILQVHDLNYKNENTNKYNSTNICEKIHTKLQGNSQRNIRNIQIQT